jgi:hypothetical protein
MGYLTVGIASVEHGISYSLDCFMKSILDRLAGCEAIPAATVGLQMSLFRRDEVDFVRGFSDVGAISGKTGSKCSPGSFSRSGS